MGVSSLPIAHSSELNLYTTSKPPNSETLLSTELQKTIRSRYEKWITCYKEAALRLLYPGRCPVCNTSNNCEKAFICSNCLGELEGLVPLQNGTAPSELGIHGEGVEIQALAYFESPLTHLVHTCKYTYNPYLLRSLTKSLLGFYTGDIRGDFFIPVPLHPVRQRERGYNQSRLIAEALSSKTGIPLEPGLLRRGKITRIQAGLQKDARYANVKDAFEMPGKTGRNLEGRHPVLVDDVCTTGATLSACAAPLIDAGATRVSAVVLGIRKMKVNQTNFPTRQQRFD